MEILIVPSIAIPCFDLAEIEEAKGEARQNKIEDLVNTLATVGFAAISTKNNTLEKVFEAAQKFFSMSSQEKGLYSEKDSLGFVPFQQETLGGEKVGYERYRYIPSVFNMPEKLGLFKDTVEAIGKEYNEIARRLVALIAEGVGVKADEMMVSEKGYSVSVKHYPRSLNGNIVHPAHRDISPITILPEGTASGLQVLVDGIYRDIVIPKGHVLVNTGELLCNKMGGMIPGAFHRVIAKDWPEQGRYQVAVFNDFPENFSLAPIPHLLNKMVEKIQDPKKREAYKNQFMMGTEEDNFLAYQLNVIGDFTNGSTEVINDLIQKRQLRNPSEELVRKFPECDWDKAREVNKRVREANMEPLFESS